MSDLDLRPSLQMIATAISSNAKARVDAAKFDAEGRIKAARIEAEGRVKAAKIQANAIMVEGGKPGPGHPQDPQEARADAIRRGTADLRGSGLYEDV